MQLGTLGVAVLGLAIAAYAAVASWRQADHTQRAADEAERATELAAEALSVAKQAHDLETTRLQAELTPQLRLDPVTEDWSQVHQLWLTNDGPVRYELLEATARPSPLILGFVVGDLANAFIVNEVRMGPIEVGDKQLLNLRRFDPRVAGTVWIEVEASRADGTWRVVLPVDLDRPGQLWSG